MSVSISTNLAKWQSVVENAADKAAAALAEQMMNDSKPLIPNDGEHNLQDIGRVENTGVGERTLSWDSVYAGYQWYGQRKDGTHVVHDYTTAGTGKAWVDEAKSRNKGSWDKVAQNGFTEGMK